MLIKNANIRGREGKWDIKITDGKFDQIASRIEPVNGEEIIDANGKMVVPPYVDSHVHLDYVCTYGEPRYNMSGTLFEGISIWSERKKTLTKEDVKKRARHVLDWEIAHGTQFVRTHVNSDEPGHVSAQALLELKEEVKDFVDLQIVAFPQHGVYNFPDGDKLLEEVVAMGVDAVGAIPHYEDTREDLVASLYLCFDLAEKYDKLVDVHCDETDDPQSRAIEQVASQAWKRGMLNRVTASHTTAMGSYNNAYAYKLMGVLQRAKINIITNATINIHLQGRYDSYPKRRGITRVDELLANGINVSMGCDDIMEPFYPLGVGDMLDVLNMGIHVSHLTGYQQIQDSLDLITTNGARTLNRESVYGIEEGKPASLLIIPAKDTYDLIRRHVKPEYSIKNGVVIMKRQPENVTVYNGDSITQVDYTV